MGQVCVKPKAPRSARVKPVLGRAASASSSAASYASARSTASATSATGVQFSFPASPASASVIQPTLSATLIEAFPTPQCFKPVSIARTRTAAGTETLACDFAGAAGCFVCDVSPIQELLLHPGTKLTAPDGTVLPNQAIYDFIQSPTNGVCVKIFFETSGETNKENKYFRNEVSSYSILKKILRDDFELFTTYAEYTHQTAFTLTFPRDAQVEIDGQKTTTLHCILQRKCNADIETLIHTHREIDQSRMLKELSCMLYLLHSNGYIHGDIKPANIVYCPNEPIQYKLIDFNLKRYTRMEMLFPYTGRYILPRLFYETVRKESGRDDLTLIDTNHHLMSEHYSGYGYYRFLLHQSNTKTIHVRNGLDLYYKSDEYAIAMTFLEINEITDERLYYVADPWVKSVIERLTDAKPYFKHISPSDCKAYVDYVIAQRPKREQSSQHNAARAARGGATSRKTKKPAKKTLKDTSKKSSH